MRALGGHLWSAGGCTQREVEVPGTNTPMICAGATVCEEMACTAAFADVI